MGSCRLPCPLEGRQRVLQWATQGLNKNGGTKVKTKKRHGKGHVSHP